MFSPRPYDLILVTALSLILKAIFTTVLTAADLGGTLCSHWNTKRSPGCKAMQMNGYNFPSCQAQHTILWKRRVDVLDRSIRPQAHFSGGSQPKEVASATGQTPHF